MRIQVRLMFIGALCAGFGSFACGSSQQCSECPAVPTSSTTEEGSTAPDGAGPGRLDAELVALAMRAGRVERIRVRTDEQGNVIKLAVYHHEESEVPEAVRQLAEERFPEAEVRYYESEVYADIGRVYEVEVNTSEGRECEVSARADGSLVYVECEIEAADIPAPVAEAVARLVPNGEIIEAESKEGPGLNAVHVEVRAEDGREHYLRFSPAGELIGHSLRIQATIEVPVQ